MKYFIIPAFIFLLFVACKKEGTPQPECPECTEEEMVCVDASCECPEGSTTLWREAYPTLEPVPPRKYCVTPNELTFLATMEPFGCVDTFAITFSWEPYEFVDTSNIIIDATVALELPGPTNYLYTGGFIPFWNEKDSLEIYMYQLWPTTGGRQNRRNMCVELDEQSNVIGSAGAIAFQGIFVHPDTIRGRLYYGGASGTLSHLAGQSLEGVDFIRTKAYSD